MTLQLRVSEFVLGRVALVVVPEVLGLSFVVGADDFVVLLGLVQVGPRLDEEGDLISDCVAWSGFRPHGTFWVHDEVFVK